MGLFYFANLWATMAVTITVLYVLQPAKPPLISFLGTFHTNILTREQIEWKFKTNIFKYNKYIISRRYSTQYGIFDGLNKYFKGPVGLDGCLDVPKALGGYMRVLN